MFDQDFWDRHWREAAAAVPGGASAAPHPYVVTETRGLRPGSALEAGCGRGAEALWLASRGWDVTAVDISAEALAAAGAAAAATIEASGGKLPGRVQWVDADLTQWSPPSSFELVTTHYAHPAMPQLAFYERIAEWVAPSGSLLIVGHLHDADRSGHDHGPPAEASVTVSEITALLDDSHWHVVTAEQRARTLPGHATGLQDVVVRARRRD